MPRTLRKALFFVKGLANPHTKFGELWSPLCYHNS